ncbi:type II toxin-antitoxin system RelE/ParE family toxin [Streptomyces sp. NBC_01800]|uniref:type II toxin-antitoxin system RelE/ParE family toxin n=1 Tax=Streptomyces sp. NBC_01800 TaxID=2975945 RepID=UPI002DDA2A44|nr:type II toxin-antitoxin system RelE/ParE family toxin [Streptomyces sp. NBC_01800]WSA70244.1 type II toxin-antitoxin system RelE/ParE family toxin [Streptomyces sp. NBC_01800]
MNEPYDVEIEPEVRAWLEAPGDHDFKRVDEVAGMLAEFGPELGGPWADHLEGPVWELRLRLRDVAPRVTYWITPTRTVVLLTVFRKSRQHEQGQIDRAARAQKACASAHQGSVTETYERKA